MTELNAQMAEQIANELSNKNQKVTAAQVQAAIQLLQDGATVPFIARYRKEATQGLDDGQLRYLEERLRYLSELEERRSVILASIEEQGKLDETLKNSILNADSKARLEDLYLPYRPKRRNKATIAIEAGLEPLADTLLSDSSFEPLVKAAEFINAEKEIQDAETALEGARQILMERFAENAALIDDLREYYWANGQIKSNLKSRKKEDKDKFSDYADYAEAIRKIPSHRALALFRGRREGALQMALVLPEGQEAHGKETVCRYFKIENQQRPADGWLMEAAELAWKTRLFNKIELELFARLREAADEDAIKVFAKNLRDLLLAAPAGSKRTLGLDPGIRTGVKAAVIDETAKVLDYGTVFPLAPQNDWHGAIADLAKMAARHQIELVSIGNGTGSRETERLVTDMIKMYPDLKLKQITVSEAGASVYSASELAATELPDLDVTIRGAVSIARRLQDPLAELVKIDPKSIGVGQYQHDVNQARLGFALKAVIEDCVNAVGVDANTASEVLLSYISGLGPALAKNIVAYRNEHGSFASREALKTVERMGEKSFQQAAGFLRIIEGENPLDATSVHPESYSVVEKIQNDLNIGLKELIANKEALSGINAAQYSSEETGLETVKDILKELEKPARDPRPDFKTVQFKEGVEDIKDLEKGMILEGVVSNVTNFGAFVNIGVHQDGLVHISSMNKGYVNNPHALVKAGEIVKVRVTDVDKERRRISLSMKLTEDAPAHQAEKSKRPSKHQQPAKSVKKQKPAAHADKKQKPAQPKKIFNTAMADALAKIKKEMN